MRFVSAPYPCPDVLGAIETIPPCSPFNTAAFATARARFGELPFALALEDRGEVASGCVGFLQRRAFYRRLVIPALTRQADRRVFREGLEEFCRSQGVWEVDVKGLVTDWPDGVGGPGRRMSRRAFDEFVLDLVEFPKGEARVGRRRRQDVARAVRAGLAHRITRDTASIASHLAALRSSQARRAGMGERIWQQYGYGETESALKSGAGRLHQAVLGDDVLASVLVLVSGRSADYLVGGTTTAGYEFHAASYLLYRAAETLSHEGLRELNLGGAGEDGLIQFKRSFGAQPREVEHAFFSLGSPITRGLLALLRKAKERLHTRGEAWQ